MIGPCLGTGSTARSPGPSRSWATGGRCSSCATCSSARAGSTRSPAGCPGCRAPSCPSASTSWSAPAWSAAPTTGYEPTAACEELRPIIFGLAEWGARWAFGKPREDELDPTVLMWWIRGGIDPEPFGDRRVVLHVAAARGPSYPLLVRHRPARRLALLHRPRPRGRPAPRVRARHALPDVGGRLRAPQRHARRPDPADRPPDLVLVFPEALEVLPRGALRPS